MFKTKNLVHDIKDVPSTWIFETYCKLKEKLIGQDVKIKSLFNSKERTPSMCIYLADDKKKLYKYKDFSSGKGGSAVDLVKDIEQISYYKACQQIVEKYNDFVLHNNGGYDLKEFKQARKYKVKSYMFRSWNTSDQYYWTQFNIGSRLLNEYCVRPLEYYTLEKEVEGELNSLTIHGNYLYGYFKKDGTLYKIYQPKTLDKKFIKVNDYIQGTEQLNNSKYLVIASSLKDLMSLKSFKMNMDVIAPDSENTLIPKEQMLEYIKKYKKVIVLFDYDPAGIEAMEKYQITYPEIAVAILTMSKDISDSIKEHGAKQVLLRLVPLLDKKLQDI